METMCVFRISKIKHPNMIAAISRSSLPQHLGLNTNNVLVKGGRNAEQVIQLWKQATAGITVRKNAVIATNILISASPEYFRPDDPQKAGHWLKERLNKWRAATEKFIAKQFPYAVCVVLCLDKSTPHYQIIDVPLMVNKKGKKTLSHYRKFGGSRSTLSKWQDLAAASVAHLGIKRGIENSTAKHTTVRQYHAQNTNDIDEELGKLRTEAHRLEEENQKRVSKKEIELMEREQRLKEKLRQTQSALAQKERQRREQERRKERAIDTRRKELVGAMLLDKAKRDPQIAMELQAKIDSFLVRDDDRALFGLPPLSEAASVNQGENPPEAENQAPKQESEEAETNFNPEPKPEKEMVAQKSPSPSPKKTAKKTAKKAVKKTAKQTA